MTITLRDIPSDLERALREKAQAEGKTVDQVALETLASAASASHPSGQPDFSKVIGTWVDDPAFDQVRRDHEAIDPDLWK